MSWLEALVRPEILALKPYLSARNEYTGQGQVQLDANESPWMPYGTRLTLNRYPEPQPQPLKQRLADIYQVDPNQLIITRGMDEGIDVLIRTCCNPGQDSICVIPPTFGYYGVAAQINGVRVIETTLDQVAQSKIIFLCTPNNPTGTSIPLEKITDICQTFSGIVAVDEAYIEFSDQPSTVYLLKQCPNLVVMRTLSKAYGLAGLRIGALIGNADLIKILNKVLSPYPIPQVSADMALTALSSLGCYNMQNKVQIIKLQRQYLSEQLSRCDEVIQVYPSDANFLLVIFKDAEAIYQKLKGAGLIVRRRDQEIPGALRITVGSEEENALLLAALGIKEQKIPSIAKATLSRQTTETEILCEVWLDGLGKAAIDTQIRFFDHMLEQLAKHSGISIQLKAIGDIDVDAHHTVEDVAIVLGQTLKVALGNKYGINRYGFVLPMDEAQAQVALDLSGRGYCCFEAMFPNEQVGDLPTEMVKHFFETLSAELGAAIHIKVIGENTHHMVESAFKCFARALGQATCQTGIGLPSTKGML